MSRSSSKPETILEHGLEIRQLRRPDQLRALTHPRRLEIMDLLIAEGALTASECAARLGDSAASCSYHLRQLARFGFVEEAEGGRGRNRPWRWVPLGNRIEAGDSAAERSAAEALNAVIESGKLDRIRHYQQHQAVDPWRGSASSSGWSIRVNEEELRQLDSAISALLAPLQRRTFDRGAPADSRMVDVLTYLLPRPGDEAAPTINPSTVQAVGPDRGQNHA